MKTFALIGAAGYIAPRHMKAIKDTGNTLIAAMDPYDGIGIMDSHFPEADFFTEFERFDRHLEKLRRLQNPVDFVSICSPNYLHDAHIRFGLRSGSHVICEKPIVLNPWNVDALMEIEAECGKRVNTILQLRLHPSVIALRERVAADTSGVKFKVDLQYMTSRGKWYHYSWKGDEHKSGGIATNIGVHFFDMLTWIFGDVETNLVKEYNNHTASGTLHLEKAEVNWLLSIDYNRLPDSIKAKGQRTFRSLTVDGENFEFSDGFTELHTRSYEEILAGKGYGLLDTRKAVEIVSEIRKTKQ
jgi:UDP-N-acetyl-2-amino-2-deoxyglucuronate dehydrogenase